MIPPFPREKAYSGATCDCCGGEAPVVTWDDEYGTTVCEDCYVAMTEDVINA